MVSEKASTALKSSAGWKETVAFIDHVMHLCNAFNTKTPIEIIGFQDPHYCAEIFHLQSKNILKVYDHCDKPLSDAEYLTLYGPPKTISGLSSDERMSLFFIGGNVASKHTDLQGDPSEVYLKIPKFTDTLKKGGLSYPSPNLFQLLL
ncbi:hypothetical protein PoB_002726200 [Plakobranchus ocellatus]|uniref:Uncharacterized protein n=1 Tax=Plakobranchus ocellatus TaxID=259542 RepID=A0AAV4A0E9_9GAST|nr:hypothetical protein PoB_002726200 [Plakobranchus ocellatus]